MCLLKPRAALQLPMMLSRSEVDFWGHLKSDSASLGARKTSLKELLGLAGNHSALIQGLGRRAESSQSLPATHARKRHHA